MHLSAFKAIYCVCIIAFIANTWHAAAVAPPAGADPITHNSADKDDAEDDADGRGDEDEAGATAMFLRTELIWWCH